jgi:hypothetical protein
MASIGERRAKAPTLSRIVKAERPIDFLHRNNNNADN